MARTYRVRISLPADTPLMIGMTAETNIVLRKADNALLVPAGAVQQDMVWRVTDGKLEKQKVIVGAKEAREVEILSGLRDGDRIVASPDRRGSRPGRRSAPLRGGGAVMLGLAPTIALKHLLARPRQSIVSLSGIVLGVAFFLAVASLMQGSESGFHPPAGRQLAAHHGVGRVPQSRACSRSEQLYPTGAVEIRSVKPLTETRGIRQYPQILAGAAHAAASARLAGAGRPGDCHVCRQGCRGQPQRHDPVRGRATSRRSAIT